MVMRLIPNFLRPLALSGLLAVALVGQVRAQEPNYLEAVSDLPLPPGLVEDVDAGISFDKPEGRIVEALARGAVAKADVAAFYRAALPGLGWKPLVADPSHSRWQRGGETLRVDIVDGSNPLIVRFSIEPD